jgi:hypothetical protein
MCVNLASRFVTLRYGGAVCRVVSIYKPIWIVALRDSNCIAMVHEAHNLQGHVKHTRTHMHAHNTCLA